MALSFEEYDFLLNIFSGDTDLVSAVSTKDIDFLSRYLLKSLDGTINGVLILEKKTNEILSKLNEDKLSNESKETIKNAVVSAYTNIVLNLSKK